MCRCAVACAVCTGLLRVEQLDVVQPREQRQHQRRHERDDDRQPARGRRAAGLPPRGGRRTGGGARVELATSGPDRQLGVDRVRRAQRVAVQQRRGRRPARPRRAGRRRASRAAGRARRPSTCVRPTSASTSVATAVPTALTTPAVTASLRRLRRSADQAARAVPTPIQHRASTPAAWEESRSATRPAAKPKRHAGRGAVDQPDGGDEHRGQAERDPAGERRRRAWPAAAAR